MALRLPGAIPALNATVDVQDPTLTEGTLASYVKIPGVTSYNMPNNPRNTNEVRTLEGVIRLPGAADPGEISISLSAMHRTHVAMSLLYAEQNTAKFLQFRFRTQPQVVGTVEKAYTIDGSSLDTLAIVSGLQDEVTRLVTEGMVVRMGTKNHTIVEIVENGNTGLVGSIKIDPAVTAAISNAADLSLYIPGERHDGVRCQVLSVSKGDVAEGSAVAGEITLQPDRVLGAPAIFTA